MHTTPPPKATTATTQAMQTNITTTTVITTTTYSVNTLHYVIPLSLGVALFLFFLILLHLHHLKKKNLDPEETLNGDEPLTTSSELEVSGDDSSLEEDEENIAMHPEMIAKSVPYGQFVYIFEESDTSPVILTNVTMRSVSADDKSNEKLYVKDASLKNVSVKDMTSCIDLLYPYQRKDGYLHPNGQAQHSLQRSLSMESSRTLVAQDL